MWSRPDASLTRKAASGVAPKVAGMMPVFFTNGQGGTLLRSLVISVAVALFVLTAFFGRQIDVPHLHSSIGIRWACSCWQPDWPDLWRLL